MRVCDVAQREGAVEDDPKATAVDLLPEPVELRATRPDDDQLGPLLADESASDVLKDARARDGMDVSAVWFEEVLELVEAVVPKHVEDGVETLIEADQLGLAIIDDLVGAELADELDVSMAAHCRHGGSQDLCDLYCEDADASG